MGTLYLVATPIGNLQDLSFRAIEILSRVEIIACEDTRHTGLLLKRVQGLRNVILREAASDAAKSKDPIRFTKTSGDSSQALPDQNDKRTLLSYYEQNELRRIPQILNALQNGVDVALVSDAGTPTVSDPGFKLVRACIAQGIKVESIPGPSSVISSLVVSGLPTDKFLFLGYLPKKPGKRKKLLDELIRSFATSKNIHPTIIFFEAPHRLLKTLEDLKEVSGDIDIVIARELTKIHEEIRREKISQSLEHFTKVAPKGEFVILLHM